MPGRKAAKWAIAVALAHIAFISLVIGQDSTTGDPEGANVKQVAMLVRECPGWHTLEPPKLMGKEKLLSGLDKIARFDTKTIRRAMGILLAEKGRYDQELLAKLFLLNRYIFNVPDRVARNDVKLFGNWNGVPYDDHHINLLWPLKLDERGKVDLISPFRGYYGEVFRPLDEFDYFSKRFGRRKLP